MNPLMIKQGMDMLAKSGMLDKFMGKGKGKEFLANMEQGTTELVKRVANLEREVDEMKCKYMELVFELARKGAGL